MLPVTDSTTIRLNEYIADSGACSRREADRLIESGLVTVDDQVASLGMRPTRQIVRVKGEPVSG